MTEDQAAQIISWLRVIAIALSLIAGAQLFTRKRASPTDHRTTALPNKAMSSRSTTAVTHSLSGLTGHARGCERSTGSTTGEPVE